MTCPIVTCHDEIGEAPSNLECPGIGMRNKLTPHAAGKPETLANSPKSLSKVRRIRASLAAQASTSGSLVPGAAILPDDVGSGGLEEFDRGSREVLIGEKPHLRLRSGILFPNSICRARKRDTRLCRRG